MKVSVQVGSNKITVAVDKTTTAPHLIRMALKRCRIVCAKFSEYTLFERAFGIERPVASDENIANIAFAWSTVSGPKVDFVLRLTKLLAVPKLYGSTGEVYKFYRCSSMYTNFKVLNNSNSSEEHIYDSCVDSDDRLLSLVLKETKKQKKLSLKSLLIGRVKRLRDFKKSVNN